MNLLDVLYLILTTITAIAFIVTAWFYYKQNNIILRNAKVTNFYSLHSYLIRETEFIDSMKKQGKSDIKVGFNSVHGAHILEAANLITEEYLNHKIDPLLFEVSLKDHIGGISIQAFSDTYSDINDTTSNIKNYPYLYKYYLLEGKKMFPSIP